MKKIYYAVIFLLISFNSFAGLYNSPGTGVNWTLSDLVANSNGSVTFDGTQYLFIDSVYIRTNDVIRIETDAIVKFNPKVVFKINGSIIINPPTNVLFSPAVPGTSFRGLWLDFSTNSIINKLTYEYASSLRISDCSPIISNSTLRYLTDSTVLANGAIALQRSSPTITNCQFLNNYRLCVTGGANVANAPKIINCIFSGNNSSDQTGAHINLGATGADTAKIIGCRIADPSGIKTGGIGFLPTGPVHVYIHGNYIANNRYGITFSGGSNINSLTSYNEIINNNIDNQPLLVGSGIAFLGGSATSHQNSIVTGNIIAGNLWGITIQQRAKPNLGNLNNADTSDDGKNRFINNTNGITPGIDLYNNTIDPIFAMGNYWNTDIQTEVEGKIFHQADNAALGLVTYSNFILPIELTSFTASRQNTDAVLQWKTAQEANSDHFLVEKSFDGTTFHTIGNVAAANNSSSTLVYNYTDADAGNTGGNVYYRLKLVDIDGSYKYSPIVAVNFPATATKLIKYYPTNVAAGNLLTTEIISDKAQRINLQYFDANGKLVSTGSKNLVAGFNKTDISVPANVKGVVMIKLNAAGFSKTIPVIAQ